MWARSYRVGLPPYLSGLAAFLTFSPTTLVAVRKLPPLPLVGVWWCVCPSLPDVSGVRRVRWSCVVDGATCCTIWVLCLPLAVSLAGVGSRYWLRAAPSLAAVSIGHNNGEYGRNWVLYAAVRVMCCPCAPARIPCGCYPCRLPSRLTCCPCGVPMVCGCCVSGVCPLCLTCCRCAAIPDVLPLAGVVFQGGRFQMWHGCKSGRAFLLGSAKVLIKR